MEWIVTYLIYVLGIVMVIGIVALALTKAHQITLRAELLKELIKHDYETDKIDLNKYL